MCFRKWMASVSSVVHTWKSVYFACVLCQNNVIEMHSNEVSSALRSRREVVKKRMNKKKTSNKHGMHLFIMRMGSIYGFCWYISHVLPCRNEYSAQCVCATKQQKIRRANTIDRENEGWKEIANNLFHFALINHEITNEIDRKTKNYYETSKREKKKQCTHIHTSTQLIGKPQMFSTQMRGLLSLCRSLPA